MSEILDIFAGSAIHAILICESWLNSNVPSSMVSIPGYKLFRNDRKDRVGGGVAIFVRECFKSKIVACSLQPGVEFLCLEVASGSEKLLISSVYRPPGVFNSEYASEFADTMSHLTQRYSKVIIGGDFNVNLLHHSSTSEEFKFFLQSLHLNITNCLPTYFNAAHPSMLDLLAVSDSDEVLFQNQISPPSSFDHDFLFLTYSFSTSSNNRDRIYSYRDYNNIDFPALHDECELMPWYSVGTEPSVDGQISILNSITLYLFNKYAPLRTRVCTSKGCPWFSADIRNLIAERDFLYRRFLRSKTVENRNAYKIIRNKTNAKIRAAKRHYFKAKLDPNLPPQRLWRNLREAAVYGRDTSECDLDPDSLNSYFTCASGAPNCSVTPTPTTSSVSLLSPQPANEFSFRCVDAAEVIGAISAVKSEAVGPDEISPRFLKFLMPWVISPVLHIFNCILTTSQFPGVWKTATVIPLAKNTSPNGPGDFRPISILCFLSKVLEKLMSHQILQHLRLNDSLTPWQSGFRSGHSCETALLKVTSDIRKSLDSNHVSILALLDFSKAFDSVNHSLLLAKLTAKFGFSTSSTALIEKFLVGRHQQVKIGHNISSVLYLKSGVPQGSILGPLLFSMYINDLPEVVRDSRIHLYADDVQIYLDRPIGLMEDCAERLNMDLTRISNWASDNLLILNPNKSKLLVLSRDQVDVSDFSDITLNGIPLPHVSNACNLGITINSAMKCCDHTKAMIRKIYGILRRLWLSANILPASVRMKLVRSLLLPYFTCGSIIFPHLDSICHRKLNVAFNDCIRFVHNLRRYDHISPLRHTVLGLSLDTYLVRRGLLFLHKIIYSRTPPYLFQDLDFLASGRHLKLRIPRFQYDVVRRSHLVHLARLWNDLPPMIQRTGSTGLFKKLLTRHLTSD